jgi:hypothetical protein
MHGMDDFGTTFAPAPDPTGKPPSGLTPVQQAIQLISLHIPKFRGVSGGLAPASLLSGTGAAGRPDVHSAVLQSVLQTILGGGADPTSGAVGADAPTFPALSPAGAPSAPPPDFKAPTSVRITPGDEGGEERARKDDVTVPSVPPPVAGAVRDEQNLIERRRV